MAPITPSLFYPRDDYAQERDEFNSVGLIFAIAAMIIIGSLIIYIIAVRLPLLPPPLARSCLSRKTMGWLTSVNLNDRLSCWNAFVDVERGLSVILWRLLLLLRLLPTLWEIRSRSSQKILSCSPFMRLLGLSRCILDLIGISGSFCGCVAGLGLCTN